MELELKHLAPYLPYKLKYLKHNGNAKPIIKELESLRTFTKSVFASEKSKPILRLLSDLTKEDFNVLTDVSISYITNCYADKIKLNYERLPYKDFKKLLSKHYDLFGLIEKGLAKSYNDVFIKEDQEIDTDNFCDRFNPLD